MTRVKTQSKNWKKRNGEKKKKKKNELTPVLCLAWWLKMILKLPRPCALKSSMHVVIQFYVFKLQVLKILLWFDPHCYVAITVAGIQLLGAGADGNAVEQIRNK